MPTLASKIGTPERLKMKTTFSLIIYLVLSTTIINAQSSIEIMTGVNMANRTIPDNLVDGDVWSTSTGFAFSSALTFDISETFSLSPGIRFIQKGVNAVFPFGPGVTVHGSVTNNYIELPVYLKYKIFESATRFFIIGGPTYSYLLSSHGTSTSEVGNGSSNDKAFYKSYDFSFDIGLRSETNITPDLSIVTGVSFSRGLVSISAYDKYEQSRDIRITIGLSRAFN
jgi:hypothetical protein